LTSSLVVTAVASLRFRLKTKTALNNYVAPLRLRPAYAGLVTDTPQAVLQRASYVRAWVY